MEEELGEAPRKGRGTVQLVGVDLRRGSGEVVL